MPRVGQFDRYINVLYRADSIDPLTGEHIPAWNLLKRLPAQKVAKSAAERVIGVELVAAASIIFRIRYREDITPRMRIKYKDRIYRINGTFEGPGMRTTLTYLPCTVEEPQDARSN